MCVYNYANTQAYIMLFCQANQYFRKCFYFDQTTDLQKKQNILIVFVCCFKYDDSTIKQHNKTALVNGCDVLIGLGKI